MIMKVMLEVEVVVMEWCCDGESEDGGDREGNNKVVVNMEDL